MGNVLEVLPTVATQPLVLLGYVLVAAALALALNRRIRRRYGRELIVASATLSVVLLLVVAALTFARMHELAQASARARQTELLIATAQNASLLVRRMRRADELASLVKADPAPRTRESQDEVAQEFRRVSADLETIVGRLKLDFRGIHVAYRSKDVTAGVHAFVDWWDTEARHRRDATGGASAAEAHTRLDSLVGAMKAELDAQ